MLRAVEAAGMRTISGEFGHVLETFQPDGTKMAKAALRKIRPGSIVVFHDGFNARQGVNRAETVRAVDLVVSSLAADGWEMVTVSELLQATEKR
jgi:hypothetical protein